MFVPSDYMVMQRVEQRSRELSQQAERRLMARRAGLDERGRIEKGLCRLVSALGCLLVAIGKRLEAVNRPSLAAPRASNA